VKDWENLLVGEARALVPWFSDPRVTDVFVNGVENLYVERGEGLELHPPFFTEAGLRDFVERLVLPLGRRLDAAQPFLDGRLGDLGRFHAIFPPAVRNAPHLSFRLFRNKDRAKLESFGPAPLIEEGLRAGQNWILCGATGTGKTTLLCRLLERSDPSERIVVVEESREIQLDHPHLVALEGRPLGPEGVGEISLRSLLRQALRMGPDRLVLGECRGEEAFDLVQAMNTGHRGSLSTLHANSCRDALRRLESLVLLGSRGATLPAVREWVAGAVQGVAFLERRGGRRRIAEIIEVRGLEGEVYRITPKFRVMEGAGAGRGSPLAPDGKVCEFTPFLR
jgi:pilus assembly protein CpaF